MRLYLCEKPSQGKDIARVLGATQRGSGCYHGSGATVTWCIGHLVEAAPPDAYDEKYKRWSIEHLPILPATWRMDVKPSTAQQFKVVRQLLTQASELVIATDADREGEMIAREIVELCQYRGSIRRLWLSALNDTSIRKALGSLRNGSDTLPLYHCALARSRADWLVGMNLSRPFTLLGRQAGHDGVLSVGRVQTPTLRLVVERDREIERFVPVPYWSIEVTLAAGSQQFKARWLPPDGCTDAERRCLQEPVARRAGQALGTAGQAHVTALETERLREAPPLPFDLGTLQEVCSRQLGLDVQETLDIAQSLYETRKATTYPRTDCGYLPESMHTEAPAVLDALRSTDPTLQPLMGRLDRTQRSRAWNDSKVTAHHGIIPTCEPVALFAMSDQEVQVYRLIRARYLAQFLPHHEFDRTEATLSCAGESLHATGHRLIAPGWRLAMAGDAAPSPSDASDAATQSLPTLDQGTACAVRHVDLKALKTQPPRPYTQGDLVKAMKGVARLVTDPRLKQKLKETTGIGTEATRAGIIGGLLSRGYLMKKGRAVRSTDAAATLIDAVPAVIADPGTTAVWEQALDMIECGQLSAETFLDKQAAWVRQIVEQHRHASIAVRAPSGPACPLCSSAMRQRRGRNGPFWSCSRYPDCKGTAPAESATKTGKRHSKRNAKPGTT
nr:DNA topoisomerase III [uncultured Caldimonas sp.]